MIEPCIIRHKEIPRKDTLYQRMTAVLDIDFPVVREAWARIVVRACSLRQTGQYIRNSNFMRCLLNAAELRLDDFPYFRKKIVR